jgi:hypothetical protein
VLSAARPAQAANKLALDVEATFPADIPNADNGWGAGLRFGREWNLVLVKLTPEIQGNYHAFGGSSDVRQFGVMGGGRVGLGLLVQPSVFAHAGVGHFGYKTTTADVSQTSLGYDLGVALDITALPLLDIGAHASLNGVAGDDDVRSIAWYAVGGHVAFSFGD